MRRRLFFTNVVVILALLVVLGACGKAEETIVPEDVEQQNDPSTIEVEKEKKNEEIEKQPEYKNVYPLTGIKTNDEVNHRVLGIMVNNHSKARPQTGLNQADIVYEVLAEGFITRFLALYQSEIPAVIGPVRSARDYYIDLSNGYDAIYIAHGYSPEAKNMLLFQNAADFIDGIKYDGTLFKRDTSRYAPHNSYITYETVKKGAEQESLSLSQEVKPLSFLTNEELENIAGTPTEEVTITYSSSYNVSYTYNGKEYVRYSAGEQTVDRESKEPTLVSNLFIVEMRHNIIDNVGRRELNLTSGGQALLAQQGKLQQVEWKNVDGQIVPYKDGKAIGLVPGKTWINIIPTSPGISGAVSYKTEE